MAEMIVAGMVSLKLFIKLGARPRKPFSGMPDQAALKLSRLRPDGGLHIRDKSCTSANVLKLLVSRT